MSLRAIAALALAAQALLIVGWLGLASPGKVLASLLGLQLALNAVLAAALACAYRRAPFAVALSALPPFAIAVAEFYAEPTARLPAALLALVSLASVLILGSAARRVRTGDQASSGRPSARSTATTAERGRAG